MRRIAFLKAQLTRVENSRGEQSKRRRKWTLQGTFVGYTNAGKSSVMNLLTSAKTEVQNALFTTLDTTTRHFKSPLPCVLSDTVGFIDSLPPELVASFHATLRVVEEADFLLEVVDVSHPDFRKQMEVVEETLVSLGCDIPKILVFNKTDLVLDRSVLKGISQAHPNSVFVSCKTAEGIENLKKKIKDIIFEMQNVIPLKYNYGIHG